MEESGKTPAFLAHSAPGRCRFKIPAKRNDSEYFQSLQQALLETPAIERVDANPLTATVLIHYEPGLELGEITKRLQEAGDVQLLEHLPTKTVWEKASAALDRFDTHLLQNTSGQIDFKSALFILLVVTAVRQLRQGQIFGPSMTLFWYALGVLMTEKK